MIDYAPNGQPGGSGFTPQAIPSAASTGAGQSPTDFGSGIFFDQGGGVPDPDDASGQSDPSQDPASQGSGQDPMSNVLQRALGSVDQVLQYGYQQFGLSTNAPADGSGGGIQDQAAAMPAVPGNPSDSGVPPLQPTPGPLPPTSNPFGKRMASNMPAVPGTQSNSGIPPLQPTPGPLPPTSNPFGRRADSGAAPEGGIQDDETQESA